MLAISLLVLLHEGGHFFFSKLFGVRVEKFFLFFDLGIGKWSGKLFSHKPKNSDTEYGVGWLPLGGYCKISGMIDESFDTEQMKQPEQPWEFRSKPAWQRLLIMIGGVLVNFLLALFIYAMILFTWGESYIPASQMVMKFNDAAKELGFRDGDRLLSADGEPFKQFDADLYRQLASAHEVEVERDGAHQTLSLPGELNLLEMLKSEPRFVSPFIPAVVDSVLPGSPAEQAGIVAGTQIVQLNGHLIDSHNTFLFELGRLQDQMASAVSPADSLKVRTVTIAYKSAGADSVSVSQVVLTPDLKLGFMPMMLTELYKPTTIEYGFFESFPAGVRYGCNVLAGYVSDMKYVFTADGAKSLGGFGAIGSLFPPMWDWYMFWKMTAFLSIILAFMNILPIPALDGGHVLFLLYEMITRRKPSEKFMIRAEYVGFGIIILLMVVANLNDILRWLGYL